MASPGHLPPPYGTTLRTRGPSWRCCQKPCSAQHRCQSLLSVDDTYAQLIRAVEDMGQLHRTYTIVSSDHGYNLGQHMLVTAKMQIYEHSLRIPTLFMGPGIAKGSTFDFLGTQVDYAPTILAMADIPTPAYMDGTDILPLLVDPRVAEQQNETLPRSVARSLARTRRLMGASGGKGQPAQSACFEV